WQWKGIVQNIQEDVQEVMRIYFPEEDEVENSND
ncbi:TPA: conjugal transfer relaxosome DNA-binding protein TraM, partial [Klebsiella variicola subsp. variicola]